MTETENVNQPKAIMVIDDETDIVYIFRKSLELAGYGVFAFTDPLLAFEHLRANLERYGLIICDVRMPTMNGLDFAREARTLSPSIAIILMSAFSMADLHITPELKIAELLQKPVSPARLKETVSKYIPVLSTTS